MKCGLFDCQTSEKINCVCNGCQINASGQRACNGKNVFGPDGNPNANLEHICEHASHIYLASQKCDECKKFLTAAGLKPRLQTQTR